MTTMLAMGCVAGGLLCGAAVVFFWHLRRLRLLELARMRLAVQCEEMEKHAQSQRALLDDAQQRLGDTFKALSADALKSNNEDFLRLAKSTLDTIHERAQGDLARREAAIGTLVEPLRRSLDQVDQKIQQLEQARAGAYAGLKTQLTMLAEGQTRLNQETGNLVKALRAPTVRGRWGEIQLRRVVELAGMVEYCDFLQQETAESDGGRLRPDMIIKLPTEKNVVVDAKAPLQSYLQALETGNEQDRVRHLQQHARHIRHHLLQLSSKAYWAQFAPTPEFVVLFLPGETFFSAALEQDPSLIEFGVEKQVILATPTTLIALLRSVAYGWRQERMAESAQEICTRGRQLYDRLLTMVEHFGILRRGLEGAVEAYNRVAGSFEARVLVSARKFRELGAAAEKEIPAMEAIETVPRRVVTDEDVQLPA
ncbi:MAG: DNA recombination protein RmuC [Deltaproteobacteria bacterium]|nr:DNA recombination protein RmuC [Deltaproteobacteria bacterium]